MDFHNIFRQFYVLWSILFDSMLMMTKNTWNDVTNSVSIRKALSQEYTAFCLLKRDLTRTCVFDTIQLLLSSLSRDQYR